MKYTGINIGPVVSTLGLAKRPRELWSASYLFSHLMKCIIEGIPDKSKIISPSAEILTGTTKIGLYPDRVFVEGGISAEETKKALDRFLNDLGLTGFRYFNLMTAECEAKQSSEAIVLLNKTMDMMELDNTAITEKDRNAILELIQKKYGSPLFGIAFGNNQFPIESLGEIAAYPHKEDAEKWGKFKQLLDDENFIADPYPEAFGKKGYKSYEKYICIVQADGDNMGKTFSHPELGDKALNEISRKLLQFGQKACDLIRQYGGMPVYAGGDDLLFIAPVVGNGNGKLCSIFHLIETIDDECFNEVCDEVKKLNLKFKDEDGVEKQIIPSMSYGVSITYYKYPLYESLEHARNLLFEKAKKVTGKNSIAWRIQKHSGSDFEMAISRNIEDFTSQFRTLIYKTEDERTVKTEDERTVSAVAHKIRENGKLVEIVLESGDQVRLQSMFKYIFECDNSAYFNAVMEIMPTIYGYCKQVFAEISKEPDFDKEKTLSGLYGEMMFDLLRTAKFIKGEDPNDD